jgi:hypothetical protein
MNHEGIIFAKWDTNASTGSIPDLEQMFNERARLTHIWEKDFHISTLTSIVPFT